jgi:hypothetical protein
MENQGMEARKKKKKKKNERKVENCGRPGDELRVVPSVWE